MPLQIHDTLSGKKQTFTPQDPNRVTLYVCGPTVYNFIHIGNARPAVVFDVLFRLLKRDYSEVVYARNITDVDDKINQAALNEGAPIAVIAERFAAAYHDDLAHLHCLPPTVEPKATDHIGQMIEMIESLIERGFAYAAEGHVLFDVHQMPAYGKLSKRSLDDMIAGARVEVAPYKKNPADFVLWKPSTPELPGWDSPWGRGRPGWHIECSAMIREHLGATIDIHGGGQDLIFPHHENEMAQGTCVCDGEDYVRYWMHNGYITMDGEKMSKSLGNVRTVRGLLEHYDGEVLRLALLSAHYKSPLNWNEELLTQTQANLDRFYQVLRDHAAVSAANAEPPEAFIQALEDDLNTPQAISLLHGLVKSLNTTTDADTQARLKGELTAAARFLGLLQQDPEDYFRAQSGEASIQADEVEALISERKAAKLAKDYARADEIRVQLKQAGVELEDTREGTRWRFIK